MLSTEPGVYPNGIRNAIPANILELLKKMQRLLPCGGVGVPVESRGWPLERPGGSRRESLRFLYRVLKRDPISSLSITKRRKKMHYGRLEVLGEQREAGRLLYRCRCSCGVLKTIRADNIKGGLTVSCGCLGRERASKRLKMLHDLHGTYRQSTRNLPDTIQEQA